MSCQTRAEYVYGMACSEHSMKYVFVGRQGEERGGEGIIDQRQAGEDKHATASALPTDHKKEVCSISNASRQ